MPLCLKTTSFIRHRRSLRTVFYQDQIWLCAQDLGRLMGVYLSERHTAKLDNDQCLHAWLESDGQWHEKTIVSESGAYALLVYHNIPENRALRYWLPHQVVATLRGHLEA